MSPDLALALSLADAADAISLGRFRASDLLVETKPDRTPVTEADRAVEEAIRERLGTRASRGRRARRGVRRHGRRRPALDRRPDRRHPELLARDPGLGDADRARGGRRDPARRRLGAGARPALVGERGAGAFVNGDPIHVSRSRRVEDAVLCFALERPLPAIAHRCWHPRATGTSGRTCSSPKGPSTARSTRSGSRSGISPRCSRSSRRPAGASAIRTASRASTAARRSRRTGSCTRPCSRPRAPADRIAGLR